MIQLGPDKFEVPAPKGMASFSLQQSIIPVAGRLVAVLATVVRETPRVGKDETSEVDEGLLTRLFRSDVLKVLPAALPLLGRVFEEMPPGELERLTRTLLGDAKCNGSPLFGGVPGGGADYFDAMLQGRTADTWALLWHALQVWYPDFFARVRALRGPEAKAKSSAA